MDPNQNPFQNDMPPVDLAYTPARGRKLAIASFILAVSSFLFLFLGSVWLEFAAATVAIVFAAISRKQAGKWKGFAIAGLVLGILVLVLTAILIGFGIYIALEAMKNPEGDIAKLLDQYFLQNTGKTFSDWIRVYTA